MSTPDKTEKKKERFKSMKISNRQIWFFEYREANPWYTFHTEQKN